MATSSVNIWDIIAGILGAQSNLNQTAPFSDIKTKPPMGGAVQNPYSNWGRAASAIGAGLNSMVPQSGIMKGLGINMPDIWGESSANNIGGIGNILRILALLKQGGK